MTLTCPDCTLATIKKNGHVRSGKQNHQYLGCGQKFVLKPSAENY